ncbi:MAG: hypothetical protein AAF449_12500 [Myxococcota bacterium]
MATVLALGKPYELIKEQLDDDYNGPVRSDAEPAITFGCDTCEDLGKLPIEGTGRFNDCPFCDLDPPLTLAGEDKSPQPEWLADYPEAYNLARETGRKVLCLMSPDSYACEPCIRVKQGIEFDPADWVAVEWKQGKEAESHPKFPGWPVVSLIRPVGTEGQAERIYQFEGDRVTAENVNTFLRGLE